ncbi:serine hydrolase domain-containing protein [Nonomuraea longicatena]|uniref:Serine hydrolase domain-containing protein n=1 Tax=Nonomuraea longicatena TaxID=83682 RepID=A0ABN1NWV6_9ACTN
MTDVSETTARALLRRLAAEQRQSRLPSVVAAVVRDGRTVWSGARGGEAGPDTQYRLGSITKSMVAVLVMRLRDEGLLDLGDPYGRHVPGTPFGEVSVGQLLSHTGGLAAEPPTQWWERTPGLPVGELFPLLDPGLQRHRPGRVFHYSNLGYALLGELVAVRRGVSWLRALRQEVLEPLGMRRTDARPQAPHAIGYAVHPFADVLLEEPEHDAGAMAPAGQLWSSAHDLARWAAFLAGECGEVLAAATLAEMREPVAGGEYGLGVELSSAGGRRLVGHGGSMPGFQSSVWADPDQRSGALFLTNSTAGPRPGLAADLLAMLEEHEPRLPAEWRPVRADPRLLELTGLWHWGPRPYTLSLLPERGLLLAPMGGPAGRGSRFVPQDDGTWLGLDGYHAGELLRVGERHLDVNTFVFTRVPYEAGTPVPGGAGDWSG